MVPDPTRCAAPTSTTPRNRWPLGSLPSLLGELEWRRLEKPPTKLRDFRPGDLLIRQGDDANDDVFLILTGFVLVTHDEPGRDTVALAIRGRGDVVGEMAGWTKQPRSASVRACGPVSAWSMPYQHFVGLQVSYPIAKAMATIFARKLTSTDQWLADSRLRPALTRTARVLLELTIRYGSDQKDGRSIAIPLTQADLATITGLSLASIERSLNKLRTSGVLETWDKNNHVTVPNINALCMFARRPPLRETR